MPMEEMKEMFEMKRNGVCPFCEKEVDIEEFNDELSKKEFMVSGLCQKCQDDFFQ